MTHWLANLVAYNVQLAVVVGAAALFMTALRVTSPRASLRFWQVLFAVALLSPLGQLWMPRDPSHEVHAAGALWSVVALEGDGSGRSTLLDGGPATLVIAVIALGGVARLGWLALGLLRLRAIARASEPAAAIQPLASSIQRDLEFSADVRFSSDVTIPATIGVRRPVVLLPHHVQHLEPALQRAILSHELIHVRGRDWLSAIMEEVWCALLWFNPAARVLSSRLSLARETLVDEATIAHTGDRRAYAAALLAFSTTEPRLPGATALIGRSHLQQRIDLIAQEGSMRRSSLAIRLAVVAGIVSLVGTTTMAYAPLVAAGSVQSAKPARPDSNPSIVLPKVVHEVKPDYTREAMQAKIQGSVYLSVVVLASGEVGDITVTRSLDKEHGLDEEAVKAMRQWTFEPGTRDGNPVPVEVEIEMRFTLK